MNKQATATAKKTPSTTHLLHHGENPHQAARVALDGSSSDPLAVGCFTTEKGEHLSDALPNMSWVTLSDLSRGVDALVRVAAAFEVNTGKVPYIAILLQHGNACGAAFGHTEDVLHHAIESNYRGSFASFLVTNVPLTQQVSLCLRQWMPARRPFSAIAAPKIDPKTAGFFARKSGNCHLFANPALGSVGVKSLPVSENVAGIRGATLSQSPNTYIPSFPAEWDKQLIEDMCLAWGICASSTSNSITVVNNRKLVANAVGQPCRTGACELALHQADKAGHAANLKGAAVASDSFFAFADGIDMLARKKVKAIFATHGSMYDREVAEHAKQFDTIFHTVPDREARVFAGH